MNLIMRLLRKKWAVVFVFIPIIHLLYVVFTFIYIKHKKTFYLWVIPLSMLVSVVLVQIMPSPSFLIECWFFLTILACAQYFRCRNADFVIDNHTWLRASAILFPILLIIALLISWSVMRNNMENTIEGILTVITEKNKNDWFDLLHPRCNRNISTINELIKSLNEAGIVLDGPVETVHIENIQKTTIGKKTTTYVTASAIVGGESYLLELSFYKDFYGEGLISLNIRRPEAKKMGTDTISKRTIFSPIFVPTKVWKNDE